MIEVKDIASQLLAAERERKAIDPFSDTYPDLDTETAYEAQWTALQVKLDAGETLIGAKLALTSRAKQKEMNVDAPLYGWMTSGMLSPYGEPVDRASLIHPRAEPEIAFLLGREVTAPATITSVLAATESVFAAVDILDSRYHNFRFTLADVVADNASGGKIILGPESRRVDELVDLRLIGTVLRTNGEVTFTAAGAATMGHPAAAVAWMINRMASQGRTFPAGSLVLSGGLTAPIPLEPGTTITAEFDQLGSIDVWCH